MLSIVFFLQRVSAALTLPLRRKTHLLSVLLTLSALTALILQRPNKDLWNFVGELLWDSYLWCAFLTLLPYRFSIWMTRISFIVIYTLCFVEIYLFSRFNLYFSPTIINLLGETNENETGEFLWEVLKSQQFYTTLLLFLPFLCSHVRLPKNIRANLANQVSFIQFSIIRNSLRSVKLFTERFIITIFFCLLFITSEQEYVSKVRKIKFFTNTETRGIENIPMEEFSTSFYRLTHAIHSWKLAQSETGRLLLRLQNIQIDSCASTCPNIIVVIGESYNKHHATIYGYPLLTTPHLVSYEKSGDLIKFTDVISPWNITSNAFKSFMSTHSTGEPGTWVDGVLFPALFRKAGYKVAFITNQFYKSLSQGSIDFNGSFFLNDPQIDTLCFDYRNRFRSTTEERLLSQLRSFTYGDRNLIILHLYGQHMSYSKRYPRHKTRFLDTDIHRIDLSISQRKIVAHYDNATLYNDAVINQFFSAFKQKDAIVIYFSDHGEEVFDEGSNMFGRNHTSNPSQQVLRSEYEIPFMVWASPIFQRRHPQVFRQIQRAARKPFSHDDLPHMLIGLGGISCPQYNAKRDPLSKEFTPHIRYVRESIDYDSVMKAHKL